MLRAFLLCVMCLLLCSCKAIRWGLHESLCITECRQEERIKEDTRYLEFGRYCIEAGYREPCKPFYECVRSLYDEAEVRNPVQRWVETFVDDDDL